jgi:adenine phosphoribosyltransferase
MFGRAAELQVALDRVRDVPDFPKPGILFKDIVPLLSHGPSLRLVVDELAVSIERRGWQPEVIACPEARGFIFGAALAYRLGVGMVPIRKPNKLPYRTVRVEYDLEYGTDALEMHTDAVGAGHRVLLVDDLLATGGTMAACAQLLENNRATVEGMVFLLELRALGGAAKIKAWQHLSMARC